MVFLRNKQITLKFLSVFKQNADAPSIIPLNSCSDFCRLSSRVLRSRVSNEAGENVRVLCGILRA